jgi:hypothetical protein
MAHPVEDAFDPGPSSDIEDDVSLTGSRHAPARGL